MTGRTYSYKEDWDAIYSSTSKSKPWKGSGVAKYLKNQFRDKDFKRDHKAERILDLGCGDGYFCAFLADEGYTNITGLDTSSVVIDYCNATNRHKESVSFKCQDIITGDFSATKRYDIIVCWLVFHHILPEDEEAFVRNISNLCKAGGTVYLSFLTSEQEGQKDRDSLVSDEHRVTYYSLGRVISLFSASFAVRDAGNDSIVDSETGRLFPYHLLKMRKRRLTEKEWIDDLRYFKKSFSLADDEFFRVASPELMNLLEDYSHYSSNKDRLLPETVFKEIYGKVFRTVSRYICKRILQGVKEKDHYIIILKINDHSSGVIFSATQYSGEEFRPHSRYLEKDSKDVKSRAYDLFLAYDHYLTDTGVSSEDRFTLHHHFELDPELKYFRFSWDQNKRRLSIEPPEKESDLKGRVDYRSFLRAMFIAPTGDSPFDDYLKNEEKYRDLCDPSGGNPKRRMTRSFYCFNLGMKGFESWGTLMIEDCLGGELDFSDILIPPKKESELLVEIKNFVFILKKIEYDYYESFNSNAIRTQAESIRIQAVKAAIAQVMARNMSHNIGSHVFSNLIGKDVEDRFDINGGPGNYNSPLFDLSSDKTPQLAYFNRYLKSRMDYLSEISFGVSDLIATKMIYGDVMKELDCVRVLLKYIPGVDNFNYGFKLYRTNPNQSDNNENDLDELTEKNDIEAAFPNDVLGCQAFYNIIENIIRNTAKHHSGRDNNAPVTFSIKIMEIDAKIVEIVEEAKEFYCVEIDNGLSLPEEIIDKLVEQQNSLLNSPILDEKTNNLRGYALGLLEMKASAAFLRQINLVEIDSDCYKFDLDGPDYIMHNGIGRLAILKAFRTKGNALGYRFFIQKPKEVLFVGDWEMEDDKKRALLSYGVCFLPKEWFVSELKNGVSFGHPFIIFNEQVQENELEQYGSLISLRRICVTEEEERKALISYCEQTNKQGLMAIKQFAWSKCVEKGTLAADDNDIRFIDHANDFSAFLDTKVKIAIERVDSRTCEKMPQYSLFSSIPKRGQNTPWKRYLSNITDGLHSDICREIREAYENRVIIIDERVQRFGEENNEDSIPCWALFSSTNVLLPRCPRTDKEGKYLPPRGEKEGEFIPLESENVFPLDPENFGISIGGESIKDKLLRFVNKHISESFVLVHYGVLERVFEGNRDDINACLTKWATGSRPDDSRARRVVVTSGRGSHSLDLPECVCFASLSSVLYACTENRNKYLISYLINQSRRKRNE